MGRHQDRDNIHYSPPSQKHFVWDHMPLSHGVAQSLNWLRGLNGQYLDRHEYLTVLLLFFLYYLVLMSYRASFAWRWKPFGYAQQTICAIVTWSGPLAKTSNHKPRHEHWTRNFTPDRARSKILTDPALCPFIYTPQNCCASQCYCEWDLWPEPGNCLNCNDVLSDMLECQNVGPHYSCFFFNASVQLLRPAARRWKSRNID